MRILTVRVRVSRGLSGVLAQLVERLNGIEEVRGSNPLGSTFRHEMLSHGMATFNRMKRRDWELAGLKSIVTYGSPVIGSGVPVSWSV